METKPNFRRLTALAQLVLLTPAALFMAALLLRLAASLQVARQVVDWYVGQAWSLWGLLVLLPLGAFFVGLLSLLDRGEPIERVMADGTHLQPAVWAIALETLAAGVILAVVAVHVMMN